MKRKGTRAFLAVLSAVFMIAAAMRPLATCASEVNSNALSGWPQMAEISEESAVLMDAENGGIMYSKDSTSTRYPASVTKIMTCLLTIENADLSDTVTMTETGTQLAVSGSTNAQTVVGEQFTVEECLYMLMLRSANDIANQLAEYVGGNIDKFAEMMNQRAAQMGCTGTHFTNPSGLPDSNHYTTAEDIAKIMAGCLENETFRKIISTQSYTVPATNKSPARQLENHCRLIDTGSQYYYQYCIGGKTGYTNAAGRTLVCAAEKDGRTLIGVTMRGMTKADFSDMAALFEYGFNHFSKISLDNGASSVNLPDGIDAGSLEKTEESTSSGGTRVVYTYGGLSVGGTVDAALSAADKADAAGSSTVLSVNSGKSRASVILFSVVLLVFAVIAFFLGVAMRYRLKMEKRRHRRNGSGR